MVIWHTSPQPGKGEPQNLHQHRQAKTEKGEKTLEDSNQPPGNREVRLWAKLRHGYKPSVTAGYFEGGHCGGRACASGVGNAGVAGLGALRGPMVFPTLVLTPWYLPVRVAAPILRRCSCNGHRPQAGVLGIRGAAALIPRDIQGNSSKEK